MTAKYNEFHPRDINKMIEEEYERDRDEVKLIADMIRIEKRNEYNTMYDLLYEKFNDALPLNDELKIVVIHESCFPVSRRTIMHATPTRYQLYAIRQFAHELKQKKYNVSHGEEIDYRVNPDKNEYFDYCDAYYIVKIKSE